ncbi:MAG: caspase family protein [Myxococcales bacterium]|nr:caspase family protein [Myxococcales bacterium]
MTSWRAWPAWWRYCLILWGVGSGGLYLCKQEALAATKVSVVRRFALIVGQNDAGRAAPRLRYAVRDAEKMRELLMSVSGYASRDIVMLQNTRADKLLAALQHLRKRIERVRRIEKKTDVWLFLYYSGHVKRGHLLLGRSSLGFTRLLQRVRLAGASLRFVVVDACESGAMVQKGLTYRREGFEVPFLQAPQTARGEVILTATGRTERAHEDPRLKGGIFTHFLLSGLRGAADKDRDQRVTLAELYPYVYQRALQHSMFSVYGPQRARFSKRLSGYGDLVLSRLSHAPAKISVGAGVTGRFFLWDASHERLLAEWSHQAKERALSMALSPGRYLLDWKRRERWSQLPFSLKKKQHLLLTNRLAARLSWRSPQEEKVASLVRFPKEVQGDFVIWDKARRRPSTRVAKRLGHAVVLELPAGSYWIEARAVRGGETRQYPLKLSMGQSFVVPKDWAPSQDQSLPLEVLSAPVEFGRETVSGARDFLGKESNGFLTDLYDHAWRPPAEQAPMWGSALAWLEQEGILWSPRPLAWGPLAGFLRLRATMAPEASWLASSVPLGGIEGQAGVLLTLMDVALASSGRIQLKTGAYTFLYELRNSGVLGMLSGLSWGLGATAQLHLSIARHLRLIGLFDYRQLQALEDERRRARWRASLTFSLGLELRF